MRAEVLSLYRALLRQSRGFADYNFREYGLRRVREEFRAARDLTDTALVQQKIAEAREQLKIVTRQSTLSRMYAWDPLVIEPQPRQ